MSEPYYADDAVTLYAADCLDVLPMLPDASVDAVVTDPPYSLSFMSAIWDTHATPTDFQDWCTIWAMRCLRVLKPGGHGVFFGGTRTFHRLACALEDAGFEIRDSIGYASGVLAWCYGSGFPKSRNISRDPLFCQCVPDMRDPATEDAAKLAAEVLLENLRGDSQADSSDLSGLHGLPVDLHPIYEVSGDPQQDVLAEVRRSGHKQVQDGAAVGAGSEADPVLRDVREGAEAVAQSGKAEPSGVLLAELSRQGAHGDPVGERLRRDGDEAGASLWSGQPGVEGRGDLQAAEGQLHRPSLRPMPSRASGDGQIGRLRDGAPPSDGAMDWSNADSPGVRQPHQPESSGQPATESGAVPDQRRPQAWRGWPICPGCGKPAIPEGLGTALKPAWEPIVVARKPLAGTVAANVLAHGTGALNIDAARIPGETVRTTRNTALGVMNDDGWKPTPGAYETPSGGRWPANVALDETAAAALDRMSGETTSPPVGSVTHTKAQKSGSMENPTAARVIMNGHGDSGGASRFFFVAGKDEPWSDVRAGGSENSEPNTAPISGPSTPAIPTVGALPAASNATTFFYTAKADSGERITHDGVAHPTVKPLALMRWLVRLATPPGGVILEPFAGSGTTVEAAILEGFRCIAIERESDYLPLITQRLNRRRDPVAYLTAAGEDLGLFDFEEPA